MAIAITSPDVNSLLHIGTGTYVRDALEPTFELSDGSSGTWEVAFPMWVSVWVEAESDDSTSAVVSLVGSNAVDPDDSSSDVALGTVVAAAGTTVSQRVDMFVPYRWVKVAVSGGGTGESVVTIRDRDYHRSE